MGPILLAWELGGGMGHLVPHRTLIRHLLERGHTVHVASRDVGRAGVAFNGLSVQHWPVPLTLDLPRRVYQPTISLAHILHNVGFANPSDVTSRIAAHRNLYSAIRPDVLLADYSSTALLAALCKGAGFNMIGIGERLSAKARPGGSKFGNQKTPEEQDHCSGFPR